jgi:hypothetical protein
MKLDKLDLIWAVRRMPAVLKNVMTNPDWYNRVYVGGGYLRSIVSGELVNDVDVFVKNEKEAELLAFKICDDKKNIVKTDNAYTIKGKMIIQIIHRWVFEKPEDVSDSFDFTVCCAVIFFDGKVFDSFCDDKFYVDLAAKRLIYRKPIRNEDAGGSMLRVLKYYQKGYRIPLDSLGDVIARLIQAVDTNRVDIKSEPDVARIITGLLREVDPNIDPTHEAHC